MCCAGCQAVAETIAGNGLIAYYNSRSAYAERLEADAAHAELSFYDRPEVQRDFVQYSSNGESCETTLMLEGITCAACVWLNERHLSQLPGLQAAEINYTTHRARVQWDPRILALSQILHAVQEIGYRAYPSSKAVAEEVRKRENRTALWRLFVAGFGMMQVMMYAVPAYLADDGTMSVDIAQLMRMASLVLTVPVIFYSAAPFFQGAWRDIRLRRLGMDVPVALGIGLSFAASVYATIEALGEVYFDSISMFVFFLLCGRYLEMRARQNAAARLEYLDRALPLAAHRLLNYPDGRDTEEVPSVALAAGDFVLVRPGEVVPGDGVVVAGETETDESLLTGESRPVAKRVGMEVVAGAVNRLGPTTVRVERVGEATRASHIRRLTERAASQRPRLVELTDRIAAWFVAIVLILAAGTALYWMNVEPGRALWIAVAVLVVTCPCALSLATPTALAVTIGSLARRGVVATREHAVEALSHVTHVVFDKTGTLTEGRMSLAEIQLVGGSDRAGVLSIAIGLEQASEHPIARALLAVTSEEMGKVSLAPMVDNLCYVAGAGVEGRIDGVRYRIGNETFVAAVAGPASAGYWIDGATPVWLGSEHGWLALFTFTDALRSDAASVIGALRAEGKQLLILSGDEVGAVAKVAGSLDIADYAGGLSPEDKHARVKGLQGQGAIVAMVGDGVNDAPVLAQAQLSIAMGSGAILSQAQSDLVLLSGQLGGLLDALHTSRRTMAIVRQNLAWAIAYNVVALPLAMAGYVTPWMAGIGMAASSLLVVLNALRLTRDRIREGHRDERSQARGNRREARGVRRNARNAPARSSAPSRL